MTHHSPEVERWLAEARARNALADRRAIERGERATPITTWAQAAALCDETTWARVLNDLTTWRAEAEAARPSGRLPVAQATPRRDSKGAKV
jgi:hypothetical protein